MPSYVVGAVTAWGELLTNWTLQSSKSIQLYASFGSMEYSMKTLADHPNFNTLVGNTAGDLGILPVLALKDYWVARVLRAIAQLDGTNCHVIFKGGTSLSKGWSLIDRFSEDIDLLVTGVGLDQVPGKGEREK